MRPASDILAELFQLAARQHGMLKAFLLANAHLWGDAATRRTARLGLAVLASMLRRLIHLLARQQVLAPLRLRNMPEPLPSGAPPKRGPRRRFRLIETPRAPRLAPNPAATPEAPALTHALFLERLARLAGAWHQRHRIARRLARRVSSGAAPLRTLCLPAQLHARAPSAVTAFLDALGDWLNDPDTS